MSLSIDQLNVRFDEHHVIHSLQLKLASKEIIAILGPSGCGKTTLLRTIAGLQKHDNGTMGCRGLSHRSLTKDQTRSSRGIQKCGLSNHMEVQMMRGKICQRTM